MSDWKVFYRDIAHDRRGQSSHPGKEAAIQQAGHLELHQRCEVEKIEAPSGEVIDRDTFVEKHLKVQPKKA
jgi:hypothetical protein